MKNLINNTNDKNISIEELIAGEVARLAQIYSKSFLDCEDIVGLTGLGRDNVRGLMSSNIFPVIKAGNRKIVSIIAFVTWQLAQGKK